MKVSFKNSVMFVLILMTLTFSAFGVTPALAAGPGAGWSYQRTITLGTATPSANFQIRVQLVGAAQHANMNVTDGRDLRFYDATDTQADYWIETWNPAGTSTVWVEVPTAGTTSLTLYYGNASATAVSNGDNTFIAFDDFSGSSINAAKWSVYDPNSSIVVSGGSVTVRGGDQLISTTPFVASNGVIVENILSSNVTFQGGSRAAISGASSLSGSATFFTADEPVNSRFAVWSHGRDGIYGINLIQDGDLLDNGNTGYFQYPPGWGGAGTWTANGGVVGTAFENGLVSYFFNYGAVTSINTSAPAGTLYPLINNGLLSNINADPFSITTFRARKFVTGYNPTITIGSEGPVAPSDSTAPTVDSFTATSPSSSLNIPITAFTASDAVGVTGYMITTSSTAPASGAAGWTGTAPTTYTVAGNGIHTLYPWAKDVAGNVSSVFASPSTVIVEAAAACYAVNFNGASQYINTTTPTDLPTGNSAYTIEAWINPNAMNGYGIVGWGNYGANNQVNAVRLYNSGLLNYWWANDISTGIVNLSGAWHHIAATFDGTTRRLYLDGSQIAQDNPSGHNMPSAANFRIGSTNNGEYFNGAIDDVRIWNVARSAAQISSNQSTRLVGNEAGLVALYRFDEGTGTSAADNAGTSFNGTLTNGSTWVAGSPVPCGIAPTVNTFSATSPTNSLTIPITAFTASDNVAVTGYLITTSSTAPSAGAAGWTGAAPTTYTVGSNGVYTLYPWAKDAAGNVSAVYGSPATITVDTTAPTVNTFASAAYSSSLNISITAFTASDNIAVTGYMITQSSTAPSAGAAGWTGSAPATYTVATQGNYTLYPWAKDAAGNVSAVFGSPLSVTVDTTGPTVLSIKRQSPLSNPTNADILIFRVTFSEPVTSVGSNSFVDTGTTTPISSSVTAVTPNLVFDFTINGIADGGNLSNLNGTVGLNIASSPTVKDLAGNILQVVEPTTDETYTLDNIIPVTVTASNQTITYGNSDPAFTFTSNPSITFDINPTCTVSGAHTNAGTYFVSCSGASASGYSFSYVNGTLTINKAFPTLSITNSPATYNGAQQTANITGSVSGTVSNILYSGSATAPTDAGSYTIKADFMPTDTTNYNSLSGASAGNFVIDQAAINVSAVNKTKVFGDVDPALTYTSDLLFGTDAFSGTLTRAIGEDVGTYAITQGNLSAGNNYILNFTGANLDITAKTVTVTADNKAIFFGSADPSFTFGANAFLAHDTFVTDPTCSVSGAHTSVGTYTIVCSGGDAGSNYSISYVDGTFSVDPKYALTVIADDQTINYGDADPASFKFTYSGFVDGDTDITGTAPSCSVSGTHTDAGSYAIVCSGGSDIKYDFSFTSGKLTVNQIAINVVADAQTKVYGDIDPALTYSSDALLSGDSLSGSLTRATGEDAGTYVITQGNLSAGSNYVINFTGANLAITAKAINIVADSKNKPFGDADPALTYTSDPLLGGDSSSGGLTRASGESVGTYAISQGTLSAGGNYSVNFTGANLTITPATNFVVSIVRANPNPTPGSSANFTVTFSQSVTGVDSGDFALTTTGVTGASITNVSGSGSTYTVTVNTGTSNGTVRLDVVDNDTIIGTTANLLGGNGIGNGNFTSGETYAIIQASTFADVPASHPYFNDIEILYANGYTAGCSNILSYLMFCPDVIIDRAQAAVFMMRGNFGGGYLPPSTPTHFLKDSWLNASWAETWAEAMFTQGLSAGCSSSPLKFCPYDKLTNAQVAVFGLRLKYGNTYTPPAATGTVFADLTDVNFWGTAWAEQAYADGLIPACGTSGGKPLFCPNNLVTRGFGASIIVKAKNLSMP